MDAIFPVSVPAYPTEIWNSHPEPLVRRGIPVVFWPLMEYDEPDFWRWSARDMLSSLGRQGPPGALHGGRQGAPAAFGTRRFLAELADGGLRRAELPLERRLRRAPGHREPRHAHRRASPLRIPRPLRQVQRRGSVARCGRSARGATSRRTCRPAELDKALRIYLSIGSILEERKAFGFGVNCYGDLIINGGRDVPCLAQALLREDGYIASCDGDFLAMESMALASVFLDEPCMMSNMYPVSYVGALRDHFGDALSPDETLYPRARWKNLARLGHCAFVGVVPPEMTPGGSAALRDFGGTWEIKRDGRGCGMDARHARGHARPRPSS